MYNSMKYQHLGGNIMAGPKAEHINPFLIAATKILKEMCLVEVKIGKPFIKSNDITNDAIIIMIGVTGEMRGQVMISFSNDSACNIASKMMMQPINQMDDISKSAISELGNMILGNAATIFSTQGIDIDITPPTVCMGNVAISYNYTQSISIPLNYENKSFEISIAVL